MTSAIRIEGLEELSKKITTLESMVPVKAGMKAAALHVKGKIATYPPSSEANVPKTSGSWYERGYGTKWVGGTGGKKTSEMLGRSSGMSSDFGSWKSKSTRNGLTWVIGNNVSYGPFVQGEKQAAFHKRRGWLTTDQVAKQETAHVTKFVKDHIDKVLEKG